MSQRAKASEYATGIWLFAVATALLASGVVVAMDGPRHGENGGTLPTRGELYELERPRLLADGWRPVPTACSTKNVCFEEFPELATNLDSGKTCGFLARKTDVLQICIGGGVADALPVESATLNPGRNQRQ